MLLASYSRIIRNIPNQIKITHPNNKAWKSWQKILFWHWEINIYPQTTIGCFHLLYHIQDHFENCALKHAKFTQKIIQESIVTAMPVSSFVANKVFCCKYYKPQIGDSYIQPDYNSISFSHSGFWKPCPDAQLLFSCDLNGQVFQWGKSR